MSKRKQPGLSWKVHFFAGSIIVVAVATLVTLIIRCARESVTVGEVLTMWLSFPGSDEPIPGLTLRGWNCFPTRSCLASSEPRHMR